MRILKRNTSIQFAHNRTSKLFYVYIYIDTNQCYETHNVNIKGMFTRNIKTHNFILFI